MITVALMRRGNEACSMMAFPFIFDVTFGEEIQWGDGGPWSIVWAISVLNKEIALGLMNGLPFKQAEREMISGIKSDEDIIVDLMLSLPTGDSVYKFQELPDDELDY